MINFRYKILGKLGEGGAGKVFCVHDTLHDRQVAMKVLGASAERRIDVDELRKEFSVLMNLSHPNLVQVYDFGMVLHSDQEGLVGEYFYTMEWAPGVDSLSYFQAQKPSSSRIELLEEVCIQTLSVLAYIHREGVIHFDIKPQNLIVTEWGQPPELVVKLTDFGLSTATFEAGVVPVRGTLEYAAPEMLQGCPIDSRVDLYSLGVTMYQLWEGHCPFEASSPVELVKKILTEELPPLHCEAQRPSPLPRLIEKLCAKNPVDRFSNALEVLLEFTDHLPEDVLRKYCSLLLRPKFVGRGREKEVVQEAINIIVQGKGSEKVFAIVGTEGIGKTSLLREVAKTARAGGIFVAEVGGVGSVSPFASIAPTLLQVEMELRSRGEKAKIPDRGYLHSNLPGGEKSRALSEDGAADWAADRRAARCYADFLLAASEKVPLVLIADDVEQMDEMSLETLKAVSERLKDGKIMLVIGFTADSPSELPFDQANVRSILLDELQPGDVAELVKTCIGGHGHAAGIPERLYQLYGGIPILLVEALRTITDHLPLKREAEEALLEDITRRLEEILPSSLEGFFSRRFLKLSKEELLLLQVIASFEYPPSIRLLKRIVPMQEIRMSNYLEGLQREGHVSLLENGERCHIRHTKLGRYLYSSIGEGRQKLHEFIAAKYAESPEPLSWPEMSELGRQYENAGNEEKASELYEAASDLALEQQVILQAIALYEKAVALDRSPPGTDRYIVLREKLARAYFLSGGHQKSFQLYEQLLSQLSSDDARRRSVHYGAGKALSRLGDAPRALRHFEEALALTTGGRDLFDILQEIVALKIASGLFREAVSICQSQKEYALAQPNKELLASVETNLGRAEFFLGHFENAKDSFTTAYEIYSSVQNKQKTIDSLMNLGNVLSATQEFRGAIAHWREALELSQLLGTLNQEAQIRNNLGIAYYHLKQFDEARQCYSRAREIFTALNSKSGIALALSNLGEVAYAEGDYEQALDSWSDALRLYRDMGDYGAIVETLLQMAQVYSVLTDTQAMERGLEEAERLVAEYRLSIYDGQLAQLKGSLLLLQGKYKGAREALEKATSLFYQDRQLEKLYWARLRLAEVQKRLGAVSKAAELLQSTYDEPELGSFPLLKAECAFMLGCIAREHAEAANEKPLVWFRQGLELIKDEIVSEVSWKLPNALAREYALRSQRAKAEECYLHSKLVIEHLASLFKSADLRTRYLSAENRARVLADISSYLRKNKR